MVRSTACESSDRNCRPDDVTEDVGLWRCGLDTRTDACERLETICKAISRIRFGVVE